MVGAVRPWLGIRQREASLARRDRGVMIVRFFRALLFAPQLQRWHRGAGPVAPVAGATRDGVAATSSRPLPGPRVEQSGRSTWDWVTPRP